MNNGEVIEVLFHTVQVAIKLGGPPLILSMLIGVTIAILQAATQIHEQTLTFVPKVLVILAVSISMSSWSLTSVQDFFYYVMELMKY